MDIASFTQPLTNRAAQAAQARAEPLVSSDFETFLRMLTTQMQNQDPLNPMESTDFATQLATFSGVEQQVQTNDLLRALQAGLSVMGMGELGGWIGMQARAEMPAQFDGAPVTLAAMPHILADRLELIVRNETGQEVQRMPIPLDDAPFTWDGTVGSVAPPLPDGIYGFSIESWSGETMLDERPAQVLSIIEEAQMIDGEVWLTMEGGLSIRADQINGLRRG